MKDQLIVSPYFKHVEEAWKLRNNPHLLFIFFEDMKKNQKAIIDKVCKFLECSLTQAEIEKLLEHSTHINVVLELLVFFYLEFRELDN